MQLVVVVVVEGMRGDGLCCWSVGKLSVDDELDRSSDTGVGGSGL